jgi:hypothetical protein
MTRGGKGSKGAKKRREDEGGPATSTVTSMDTTAHGDEEKAEKASPKAPPPPPLVDQVIAYAAPVATLIWCWRHAAIEQRDSHEGRLWLAGAAAALVVVTWLLARFKEYGLAWPRTLFDPAEAASRGKATVGRVVVSLWLAAAVFGVFNYYQFDGRVFSTPGDYNDATYYYLNSKYFPELGYSRLYHAMLVADSEGRHRFNDVSAYRDLSAYDRMLSRREALARADEVKRQFTPARWREFRHDVDWLTSRNPDQSWSYFFIDHGYNPPPSWTLVGGTLAGLCPVERIGLLTKLDLLIVVAMFAAIGWAFGGPTLLVSILFFLVTFSGRWPILGQSILRFDWLACLVVTACMLRKGKHGLAGALLAYSMLNRVFPGIFGVPYALWMARDLWRAWRGRNVDAGEKAKALVRPAHRRFIVGVAASLLIFGGGALAVYGPGAFAESAAKLKMHGGPDSFSSHRVGLAVALVYDGEWSRRDFERSGGLPEKIRQLWRLQPVLRGVGLLMLVLMTIYVWRTKQPVWQLVWLGVFPLFALTFPQINYYNLRLLLVLAMMSQFAASDRGRAWLVALVMLFLVEVVAQYVMVEGATRYAVTSITSLGLCGLFAWLLGLLLLEVRRRSDAPAPE